jgi:hypothetical protein
MRRLCKGGILMKEEIACRNAFCIPNLRFSKDRKLAFFGIVADCCGTFENDSVYS